MPDGRLDDESRRNSRKNGAEEGQEGRRGVRQLKSRLTPAQIGS